MMLQQLMLGFLSLRFNCLNGFHKGISRLSDKTGLMQLHKATVPTLSFLESLYETFFATRKQCKYICWNRLPCLLPPGMQNVIRKPDMSVENCSVWFMLVREIQLFAVIQILEAQVYLGSNRASSCDNAICGEWQRILPLVIRLRFSTEHVL